jgi:hypothetical protein
MSEQQSASSSRRCVMQAPSLRVLYRLPRYANIIRVGIV